PLPISLSLGVQPVDAPLRDDVLGRRLSQPFRRPERVELVLAEKVGVPGLHGVAEGRIANAPMKAFPPVGTEALVAEIGVEAAPLALDVRVAIVVEEQIDLEDSSQDVVDLDAIDLVHGEVVLLAVELALACEVVLDAVPALQQSLEQESAGARRGVDDVVAPVDVESGHGEARDLAHREVLAQL